MGQTETDPNRDGGSEAVCGNAWAGGDRVFKERTILAVSAAAGDPSRCEFARDERARTGSRERHCTKLSASAGFRFRRITLR